MPLVEGKGRSVSTSPSAGRAALLHGSFGRSPSTSPASGRASLLHGSFGLSVCAAVGRGKLIKLVKLSTVQAITANMIRVTFDRAMLNNLALDNPSNYVLSAVTTGAAPLTINDVIQEGTTNPTFVELMVSEMTHGATYNCLVNDLAGIQDPSGALMDSAFDNINFTGVGDAPGILQVIPISQNRVDVVFDEAMTDNADIRNPAKYAFNNGLTAISVLDVKVDTAKLVTSDQVPGTLYTLTLTP